MLNVLVSQKLRILPIGLLRARLALNRKSEFCDFYKFMLIGYRVVCKGGFLTAQICKAFLHSNL